MDPRAAADHNGNVIRRFLSGLIQKLKGWIGIGSPSFSGLGREASLPVAATAGALERFHGSVPGGASSSRRQNDESVVGGTELVETRVNIDPETVESETVVDVERDGWVTSIQEKIDQTAETETISIPRVPEGLREFYPPVDKPYEPRFISIGPYHRGNPRLNYMEKQKWQRLKANSAKFHLNVCFRKLKDLEEKARRFYPETNSELNRREFLEMLLLDGCFIVDYLDHASSDNSKTEIWNDLQIRYDLLLLENQLPFFVVECIYGLAGNNNNVVEAAVKFFQKYISPKDKDLKEAIDKPEERTIKHLLHLYHAYLFYEERDGWVRKIAPQVLAIPSAVILKEAGIKFEKDKALVKAMEVRFKNGVMHITPLVINTFTISQFLNLIEFERAHPNMEPQFTAFVQFMEYIVKTSEDVALLRKKGILEHAFGSDAEVARILNRLIGSTFHYLPSEMDDVYAETDRHCQGTWNSWRAAFLRDYYSSPWAFVPILNAFALFINPLIQTVFIMVNRFRPVFPQPPPSPPPPSA